MTSNENEYDVTSPPDNAAFATTRWSLILSAGDRHSPDADRALESLCQAYWYPLYAFARRWGCSPEDAADRTQEFFARLLEKDFLLAADRTRGRFRSFLLIVFKRFLTNAHEREQAQKRGGGRGKLSIDAQTAEQRYAVEPSDAWTPEALFERRWALTVLEYVMDSLQSEYSARGKLELFEQCKPFLTGSGDATYTDIAEKLQMTDSAVRVAVHRLRERFRDLLRLEVAQTIAADDSVEDELNHLRRALRGPDS